MRFLQNLKQLNHLAKKETVKHQLYSFKRVRKRRKERKVFKQLKLFYLRSFAENIIQLFLLPGAYAEIKSHPELKANQ